MRTAIVSTFPPRACGIGAFAADVRAALLAVDEVERVEKVVVVNKPSRPQRPGVIATIMQAVRADYTRAARILGRLDVDVVLLQHEYGIFGGADGEYVLSLAEQLSQPLVVTLHTVLSEPTDHQAEVLAALCRQAERVIVMTETARRLLVEGGTCAVEKVRIVPHGAPAIIAARAAEFQASLASADGAKMRGAYSTADGRFLLSTFGLLSSGKGIETVIEALPEIVERYPEVLYTIAGRTHPDVVRREGEQYRLSLEQMVLDLGLESHVEFDDRYLSIAEIAELLAATNVFVTPYKGREQVASGALTYAIAAGCGVVSTPYWYAQDMLGSGAGTIVPFADPAAITDAVCGYIEEPARLLAARVEARVIGGKLAWPSVACATARVLREAVQAAPRRRRPLTRRDPRIVSIRTDHLFTLVDDVGIMQHANGVIPNRETGYCVVNSQGGARYEYESKTYTLRLSFTDRGQAMEVDALCEYAADGLPAAYTCDKQVVVLREGGAAKPEPTASGSKTWMHNGSVMRLDASGEARKFFYEKPRSGIAKNGASQGTLLFEGRREANRYVGTAYIFKAGCDPAPYEVSGDVASDQRSVVMTGDAPRLDATCKVIGTKVDRLIFTHAP